MKKSLDSKQSWEVFVYGLSKVTLSSKKVEKKSQLF